MVNDSNDRFRHPRTTVNPHTRCAENPATIACVQLLAKEQFMAKAYWISFYREIRDPAKMAAYAKLAVPAIEAGGGRFLAGAVGSEAYEAGELERGTVIQF